MSWTTPKEPPLVVLRDLDRAREALGQALRSADETTRPGLAEAVRVLEQFDRSDDQLVLDWARRTLDRAAVDPGRHVQAVAALRSALPAMSLRAATALAVRAAAEVGPHTG